MLRPFLSSLVLAAVSVGWPAFGQSLEGFERPPWARSLPIEAEARIGEHLFKAVVAEKPVPDDGAARAAEEAECWPGDMVVLSVSRDGRDLHEEEICSAYALSWLRLHEDGRGSAYLFVGRAEGRGTHATVSRLRVYSLGPTVRQQADVPLAIPMTPEGSVIYGYRATPAPGGGLIVDREAIAWPEDEPCCDDMPRSDQIRIPPAD